MARFEVVIPWYPVKVGDIIETDNLHPAIKPNVRELPEKPVEEKTLEVATPRRGRPPKESAE